MTIDHFKNKGIPLEDFLVPNEDRPKSVIIVDTKS